jgi:hypothetical protein
MPGAWHQSEHRHVMPGAWHQSERRHVMPGAWHQSECLASAKLICQVGGMNQRRFTAAGGIFLFLGPIIGALIGIGRGEPILGMMYGFAAGVALALLVWAIDRWKR